MDSQDEHEEIIQGLKVMVYGFVSKGIIPSSALDVINNKLQPDRINLFLSFGIDLRVVLSCIPLEPNVQVVKVEKDVDPSSEDFDANFTITYFNYGFTSNDFDIVVNMLMFKIE